MLTLEAAGFLPHSICRQTGHLCRHLSFRIATIVYVTNMLACQSSPKTINTYYLTCVPYLAMKEVIGWSMSKTPNAELVKVALNHVAFM
ncbi:MAG: hypothetical protein K0U40_10830 [Betaproteobacteria bacterium]|nr:hypothetical protein [Betaproteobacteria bacterium]